MIMKNFNKMLFVFVLVMAIVSCEKANLDDELSEKRTDYTGNELRTDGYYYEKYLCTNNEGVLQDDGIIPMFLYRNGVATYGYVHHYSELEQAEERFKNGDFYKSMKNDRFRWRVFHVYGNIIEFEGQDDVGYGDEYVIFKDRGEIIDDTTFILKESIVDEKVTEYALECIYHFKQFAPKPDSTNNFIK